MEGIEDHEDREDDRRFEDVEIPFMVCEIAVGTLGELDHTVD
jgi:hypothetical protein